MKNSVWIAVCGALVVSSLGGGFLLGRGSFGNSTRPVPVTVVSSPASPLTESFRPRLQAVLDSATRLQSACNGELSLGSFSEQLQQLKGDYELAKAEWPSDQFGALLIGFDGLIGMHDLTKEIWKAKAKNGDFYLDKTEESKDFLPKNFPRLVCGSSNPDKNHPEGQIEIEGSNRNLAVMFDYSNTQFKMMQELTLKLLHSSSDNK